MLIIISSDVLYQCTSVQFSVPEASVYYTSAPVYQCTVQCNWGYCVLYQCTSVQYSVPEASVYCTSVQVYCTRVQVYCTSVPEASVYYTSVQYNVPEASVVDRFWDCFLILLIKLSRFHNCQKWRFVFIKLNSKRSLWHNRLWIIFGPFFAGYIFCHGRNLA